MRTARGPLASGVALLLVLAGLLYLVAGRGAGDVEDTTGGVLGPADRQVLDAPPVARGAAAPDDGPGVDLRDPVAVATAYVVAGYSQLDTDAGHTNRRAVRYAAPATPPETVGVLVVSPPPAGHRTTAAVDEVTLLGADPTDTRRGYLVGYRTRLEPPGPSGPERRTRYLLLVHQPDGRWLVAADGVDAQVGEP